MPRITAIEATRRDPNRVAIFLDDEFAFAVAAETAVAEGLRMGETLDAANIDRLVSNDEAQRALAAGLRYLGARPRSTAEVRRRLREKGYGPAAIDAALARLSDYGYVDDRAFAEFWVAGRQRHKPRSSRLVAYELRQKGVTPDAVDWDGWDETETAKAAAEQWLRSRRFTSREEFQRRVGGHLQRRGFSGTVIRGVLRDLDPSLESG